jgi:ABC-2 type transport system permease protein
MTWIQALEYKANTVVGTFAIFSGLVIEFLIWKQIFETQGLEEIRGFTFSGLMVYIFLSMVVGQLKSSWATSMEMIDAIRTGELNKYLIRPISFFTYHFMIFIGYNSLFYLSYSVLIIVFPFFFPGFIFSTILHIFGFFIALIISVYLSYTMYYAMVCFAFWFGEVRSLVVTFNIANIVLAGQVIPIHLFPDTMKRIIELTPIRYLIDFPVSIATGRLPVSEWSMHILIAVLWCVVMTVIGQIVYKFGIKVYGGYGA